MRRGDCLKVETTTRNDVFGTVVYRVEEMGLDCPAKGCQDKDGVKLLMLGGSGPAAHPGRVIYDCQKGVEALLASPKAECIDPVLAERMAASHEQKKTGAGPGGVREISI